MLEEVGDVRPIAVDTEQAVRIASLITLDADVAVVDVPGPGTPGEALVGQLTPGVPVVAMSLHGSMQRLALQSGAALFVEKDGDGETALHWAAREGHADCVMALPFPRSRRASWTGSSVYVGLSVRAGRGITP